jgi:hypothetical protein
MKCLIVILSLINGLWMLTDGVYVMRLGKYIGPEKPGPWASLIGLTGLDVFKLGPLFIVFGLAWIVLVAGLITGAGWGRTFGMILSTATLWYAPFGTLISIIVLIVLVFFLRA